MTHWIAAALICLALASAAPAGVVAPAKPSQLTDVTTTAASPACSAVSGSVEIDGVQKADGTTSTPFAIPLGQVFVVTEIDVSSIISAAHKFGVTVFRQAAGGSTSNVTSFDGSSDANGVVHVSLTFPTGASVKSGTKLCAGGEDLNTSATFKPFIEVHGFFTRDI